MDCNHGAKLPLPAATATAASAAGMPLVSHPVTQRYPPLQVQDVEVVEAVQLVVQPLPACCHQLDQTLPANQTPGMLEQFAA